MGIGIIWGISGGESPLESSEIELEEKQEPKGVSLSMGETAIILSEWESEGKVKQQCC